MRFFFLFLIFSTGLAVAAPIDAPVMTAGDAFHLLVNWAQARQQDVLTRGRPLTAKETELAKHVGVLHPERVRVLGVDAITLPESAFIDGFPSAVSLNQPTNVAQTLEYGILIRNKRMNDRTILAHELAHVAQYERLGGLKEFLRRYLHEIETMGYDSSPLEQEAIGAEIHSND